MTRENTIIFSLLLCFCLIGTGLKGQDSYAVINVGKVANIKEYTDAVTKLDLSRYRRDNERVVLRFTTGVEIVLYSQTEINKGISVSSGSTVSSDVRILKLGPNGQIAEQAPPTGKNMSKSATRSFKDLQSQEMPDGYPTMKSSGNKREDQEKYRKDKQKWMADNPEEYAKLSKANEHLELIPRAEYYLMSQEKKEVIMSNPSKYKIQE